jgi:hypothetical protein
MGFKQATPSIKYCAKTYFKIILNLNGSKKLYLNFYSKLL